MEVQGVKELDSRVRRVHLDVGGDVEQPFAVVEDDPHPSVDEVVRNPLRRRGRNGQDADDDVLVADGVPELAVRLDLDAARAPADDVRVPIEDRGDVDPVLGEDRRAGDRLAEAAGADERDVVLPLCAKDLADLSEQAVDAVADAALAELAEAGKKGRDGSGSR
jgi:hypothetical protein